MRSIIPFVPSERLDLADVQIENQELSSFWEDFRLALRPGAKHQVPDRPPAGWDRFTRVSTYSR